MHTIQQNLSIMDTIGTTNSILIKVAIFQIREVRLKYGEKKYGIDNWRTLEGHKHDIRKYAVWYFIKKHNLLILKVSHLFILRPHMFNIFNYMYNGIFVIDQICMHWVKHQNKIHHNMSDKKQRSSYNTLVLY